ncbi:hypothetical protein [Actinoplanes sp. URMC 104]|uniref:hypothetical protein n=1 Tax=Actinoplanes sp. URMC 104 TaxID=3423409 RepID=UPI003F1A0AC3
MNTNRPAKWTPQAVAGLTFWAVVLACAITFIPDLGGSLLWLAAHAVEALVKTLVAVMGVFAALLLVGFGRR